MRDCGSSEVGRVASLRLRNALLEKSRGPEGGVGVRAPHGDGRTPAKT